MNHENQTDKRISKRNVRRNFERNLRILHCWKRKSMNSQKFQLDEKLQCGHQKWTLEFLEYHMSTTQNPQKKSLEFAQHKVLEKAPSIVRDSSQNILQTLISKSSIKLIKQSHRCSYIQVRIFQSRNAKSFTRIKRTLVLIYRNLHHLMILLELGLGMCLTFLLFQMKRRRLLENFKLSMRIRLRQ